MSADVRGLPLVDEHAVDVAATADAVWGALVALGESLSGAVPSAYARLVGGDPSAASGPRPLEMGSTVPGFAVVEARRPELLVLAGRHRFSRYALTFRIDARADGSSRLTAESRAVFPGLHGRAYRAAVIGTGLHVVAVRRLLAGVARRAAETP